MKDQIQKNLEKAMKKEGYPIEEDGGFNKITKLFNSMEKERLDSINDCLTQNINEHNANLNLLWGILLGIFSSLIIQISLEILKLNDKKISLLFFFLIISFFLFFIIIFKITKTIKQTRKLIEYHLNKKMGINIQY